MYNKYSPNLSIAVCCKLKAFSDIYKKLLLIGNTPVSIRHGMVTHAIPDVWDEKL
jgi:hypothetical protein